MFCDEILQHIHTHMVKFVVTSFSVNLDKCVRTVEMDPTRLIRELLAEFVRIDWPHAIIETYRLMTHGVIGFTAPMTMNKQISEIPGLTLDGDNHVRVGMPFGNSPPILEYKWLRVIDENNLWDAVNLYDKDPINLGPIGSWEGWGRGPTIVPKTQNNKPDHLVVVDFQGKKVFYNSASLSQWILSCIESERVITLPHNGCALGLSAIRKLVMGLSSHMNKDTDTSATMSVIQI